MTSALPCSQYPATEQLLDQLNDAVYMLDCEMKVTFWNQAAERITGYSASQMVGRPCRDTLKHCTGDGLLLCDQHCPMRRAMREGKAVETVVHLNHCEGQRLPVAVRICPARDAAGNVIGALQVFSDDALRTMAMQRISQLQQIADNDQLTGLRNRRFMIENVELRIAEAQRTGNTFACVFIDIDRFKSINDRWGHDLGDSALKVVARTIGANMTPFDTAGRWGGEEFLALLAVDDASGVPELAQRLGALIRACRLTAGREQIPLSASIGATVYRAGDDVDSIIQRADRLMYRSKQDGRDRVTWEL